MNYESRKRKEKEALYSTTSSKPLVPATKSSKGAEQQPLSSDRLLAGYMSYEFLTKGTLFGQKFEPVKTADSKRNRKGQPSRGAEPTQSYFEAANLVKSDAHIPGVVNPAQLARWINQM